MPVESFSANVSDTLASGDRPSTVNRTLQLLHQSFALAVRRGTLSRVPYIRRLSEVGNARQGFFTEQEVNVAIRQMPKDLRDFVRFAALTGMRRGEIISLEWSDVHGDVLTLRGENSKNGSARNIPLVGELEQLIERRLLASVSKGTARCKWSPLFFLAKAQRSGGLTRVGRRVAAGFGKMVCPKCQASGTAHTCEKCETETTYRGRIFHDPRRSAVRAMTQAGVPQAVAIMLLP